ncbi:hypothetical protein LRY65_01975 [Candidatus Woesebacteria bacterium]|nr:hypothetical protein [Candidatus Woesebacteria bacterium]MCD8507773.1 hypothetical protein [Candidatus Woesebacteria bacterium]MCD8526960.1 hypothetical protein [Candidatus Woesebacteria bacterium]MCD8545869.1 hypothetical protein [Candidatus Woesebacteria bacterium]
MISKFSRNEILTTGLVEAQMHPFRVPASPELANEYALLPPSIYGDLLNALGRQALARPDQQVEESQFLGMQRGSVIFDWSPVFVGDPSRTHDAAEEVRRWFRQNPTAAAYWHTHTEQKAPSFTPDDLARALNFSRRAIWTLLGSRDSVYALLRTHQAREALPPTHPMGFFNRDWDIFQAIEPLYTSDENPPDFSAVIPYLEQHGYVLYSWIQAFAGRTVPEAAANGDFYNGISLQRIIVDSSSSVVR